MRIGVCVPQLGPAADAPTIAAFAETADRTGVDSLWVEEHLFKPLEPLTGFGGRPGVPWPQEHERALSPFEVLAYLAGITTSCRLGTSIVVVGYHHPVVLAKQTATIDVLSQGRMMLGLGVGWCEDEYRLLGRPFRSRGTYADEALDVLRQCWSPGPVEFHGEQVDVPRSQASPKPVSGDLPIHGGFQSRAGLRRVAKWCDTWHPSGLSSAQVMEGLGEINRVAADEFGRAPLTATMRVLASPGAGAEATGPMKRTDGVWGGTHAEIADRIALAREDGIHELVLDANFAPRNDDPAFWGELAESLPLWVGAAHA